MPIYTYPFIKFPGEIHRPYVPICAINPAENIGIRSRALLDTGADSCVFPKVVADITQHNLMGNGVLSSLTKGVGGKDLTTWKHTFLIQLYSFDQQKIVWQSTPGLIDCIDHNDIPIILGGKGFMEYFKITFDYPRKKVLIEVD